MPRRVVITGLGAICGLGTTVEDYWAALRSGQSAIKPLGSLGEGTRISIGAVVPDFKPERYFSSAELPLLDRFFCPREKATQDRDALESDNPTRG